MSNCPMDPFHLVQSFPKVSVTPNLPSCVIRCVPVIIPKVIVGLTEFLYKELLLNEIKPFPRILDSYFEVVNMSTNVVISVFQGTMTKPYIPIISGRDEAQVS